MLQGLESLEKLYLHENYITDIAAQSLTHINRCKELRLSNNNLTGNKEKGCLKGLDILEILALSENDITHIEDGAFSSMLRNFTELQLYGNKLTHISVATFEGLSHLTYLTIAANEIVLY